MKIHKGRDSTRPSRHFKSAALNEFKGQGSNNNDQRTSKQVYRTLQICTVPNTNKHQTKGLTTNVIRHFKSARNGQGCLYILKMAITKDEQLSLPDTSSSALSVFTKGNVIIRVFSNDQNKSIKAQNSLDGSRG